MTALSVPVLGAQVGLAMVGGFHGIWWGCDDNATRHWYFFGIFGFASNGGTCYATSSTLVKLFPPDYLSSVIQFRSQIFTAGLSLILWVCFDEINPLRPRMILDCFWRLGLWVVLGFWALFLPTA